MEKEFKSGFVTLIGRTNVGKSTLLNLLVGEKVAKEIILAREGKMKLQAGGGGTYGRVAKE